MTIMSFGLVGRLMVSVKLASLVTLGSCVEYSSSILVKLIESLLPQSEN